MFGAGVLGRHVRELVDADVPAGDYSVVWDGRDYDGRAVSSGVYFYRLTAGVYVNSKKMMLIK